MADAMITDTVSPSKGSLMDSGMLPITERCPRRCSEHMLSGFAQREERLRLRRKDHKSARGPVKCQEHVLFADVSAAASANELRFR